MRQIRTSTDRTSRSARRSQAPRAPVRRRVLEAVAGAGRRNDHALVVRQTVDDEAGVVDAGVEAHGGPVGDVARSWKIRRDEFAMHRLNFLRGHGPIDRLGCRRRIVLFGRDLNRGRAFFGPRKAVDRLPRRNLPDVDRKVLRTIIVEWCVFAQLEPVQNLPPDTEDLRLVAPEEIRQPRPGADDDLAGAIRRPIRNDLDMTLDRREARHRLAEVNLRAERRRPFELRIGASLRKNVAALGLEIRVVTLADIECLESRLDVAVVQRFMRDIRAPRGLDR